MPVFIFICNCFSHNANKRKNSPSIPKDLEENGTNNLVVPVSSKKPIIVDSKVTTSSCNESISVNVISELQSNHVGQSILVDSEGQNNECNIGECEIFKYSELEKATNNFDSSRVLGSGGYGTVYSGTLKDGRLVAIKRLHEDKFMILRLHDNKLEEERQRKFINEVAMLTRLRHENLVHLYGCTSPKTRELLLVQEYIPNGTVADRLHRYTFPWSTRLNVAVQTASALAYLHASNIIHRDVKTCNILLDRSLNAKVADFGLSRLVPHGATHISTNPAGTRGYIDPEYIELGHLSDKSDVYSFGVVLIELISSLPAFSKDEEQPFLSDFAMEKLLGGQLEKVVDPNLGFGSDKWISETISAVSELAFGCLQPQRNMRPSMAEVFNTLDSINSGSSQISLKLSSNHCYNATKIHIVSRLPDDYFEKK
ncbi:LEAF RUST 10 DISEASE-RESISTANCEUS RECEPTOR-LIKE PROTEIN KINASE-like 1.2 [Cicer arietinum]|uniref:LEAF RUST 10 DISEASE-RESISTANCE LOCUS RECEPTOR-LIKE PROTEIN KINASE-like 1.2 n=1 Tax=Cicer arietinum TaxID=3827 RepID=A0A1S2Z0L8_CICAR|nr:LEAF RUST 10 DISEASE-RESISTANCE LOCUS RECEPTOR-LIKE PROTEIN KINASE-like 1.2 [Cicer arietinum]